MLSQYSQSLLLVSEDSLVHGVEPCLPPCSGMYVQCSPINGMFESGHPLYNAYVRTDDLSSKCDTNQKCSNVILLDLLMPNYDPQVAANNRSIVQPCSLPVLEWYNHNMIYIYSMSEFPHVDILA